MNYQYTKIALAAVWILATSIAAIAVGAGSAAGWTVFAAIALTPPIVMTRLWNAPVESMSESIRGVLR
jgi:hypothetical protein